MAAKIVRRTGDKLVVEVEIDLSAKSMLSKEMAIREAVNEAGGLASSDALSTFDTDGSPIIADGVKWTSKGKHTEIYECPYGSIVVPRHVYQSSTGGKTFCPLESGARMILNSTPAYAKTLSYNYAHGGARRTAADLLESDGRKVCPAYIKNVCDFLGAVAAVKEDEWVYDLPDDARRATSVSVGLDGTCMLLIESGWRLAMTGTISFYNDKGERLYTIYMGATPEYGKEKFLARFDRELARVRKLLPNCEYVGLADGAPENWTFLAPRTDRLVLDFYHSTEYVKQAANSIFPGARRENERISWVDDRLHRLKHKHGAAKRLLDEMTDHLSTVAAKHREPLQQTVTYFTNHYQKMGYAKQLVENMAIGSGVTEAACKELIKQRLCNSGMRWKEDGAAAVIAIRSLVLTGERWTQFWNRIAESGCPCHKAYKQS